MPGAGRCPCAFHSAVLVTIQKVDVRRTAWFLPASPGDASQWFHGPLSLPPRHAPRFPGLPTAHLRLYFQSPCPKRNICLRNAQLRRGWPVPVAPGRLAHSGPFPRSARSSDPRARFRFRRPELHSSATPPPARKSATCPVRDRDRPATLLRWSAPPLSRLHALLLVMPSSNHSPYINSSANIRVPFPLPANTTP